MPSLRRIAFAACLGAGAALAAGLAACVIADPPPDLPKPPHRPPSIVHASIVPPEDRVLTEWPAKFVVPVEILDPTLTFNWAVFVDFDPLTQSSAALYTPTAIDPREIPDAIDGGVYQIELSLDRPADDTRCHDIQFLIAHAFTGTSAHTPDAYGADVAHWFYNPAGDVGACATYDAGAVDGAFPPEAGPDVIFPQPTDGGVE